MLYACPIDENERLQGGNTMSDSKHPELHVNEEPRNDFIDVAVGMAVTTIGFLLIAVLATILSLLLR
jgi:hypothetical protein